MKSYFQNLSGDDESLSFPESSVNLMFRFIDPRGQVFTINLLLLQPSSVCEFSGELEPELELASLQVSFSTSAVVTLWAGYVFDVLGLLIIVQYFASSLFPTQRLLEPPLS